MANYAQLSQEFWTDNYILDIEPDAKLLFIYLLTNAHRNTTGIYEIHLRTIAYETGIDLNRIKECLSDYSRAGKVFYEEGFIILTNRPQHTSFNNDNVRNYVVKHVNELPASIRDNHPELIESLLNLTNQDLKRGVAQEVVQGVEQGVAQEVVQGIEQGVAQEVVQGVGQGASVLYTKSKVKEKESKEKKSNPPTPLAVVETPKQKQAHLQNSALVREDGRSEWGRGVWFSDKEWRDMTLQFDEALMWEAVACAEKQYMKELEAGEAQPKTPAYVKAICKRIREERNGKPAKR